MILYAGLVIMSPIVLISQSKPIKVCVREELSGIGVPSKIVMVKGENDKIPVDYTNPRGELLIPHECAFGERFYAEPKDGSFYQSDEVGCRGDMTLLVAKRETPDGVLVKRRSKVVRAEFKDGSQAVYIVSWNGRVKKGSELEVGAVSGGFPGVFFPDIDIVNRAEGGYETLVNRISTDGGMSNNIAPSLQGFSPGEVAFVSLHDVGLNNLNGKTYEAFRNVSRSTVDGVNVLATNADATNIFLGLLPKDQRNNVININLSDSGNIVNKN